MLFLLGHCPHDELPEEVNTLIHDFIRRGPAATVKLDGPPAPNMANATDDDPATPAEIVQEEIKLITEDLKTKWCHQSVDIS